MKWVEKKKLKEFKSAKIETAMVIKPKVASLMEKMGGYTPGMGLGRFGRGITQPIKVDTQKATYRFGLGYKEGTKIIPRNKKILNENFVNVGQSFPYRGFLKPWQMNGDKLLHWRSSSMQLFDQDGDVL